MAKVGEECKRGCPYCRGWEGICKYGQVPDEGRRLCDDTDHVEIETDEDSDDSIGEEFMDSFEMMNNYVLML